MAIGKIWNKPLCPTLDEWIEKRYYNTHSGMPLSHMAIE
jgi:hypothetical protein